MFFNSAYWQLWDNDGYPVRTPEGLDIFNYKPTEMKFDVRLDFRTHAAEMGIEWAGALLKWEEPIICDYASIESVLGLTEEVIDRLQWLDTWTIKF